ncbi:hypothetical protein HYPSUDRAFT_72845 [Hypholoma sublateritium FD-334 SS-4]|uniref:Secreted protein n=1 Tax=Hypholoma sublateritium (strain FD-334 SS-4) TaxID=945553 RepID=A0A0D2KGZ3_HYPSF|nr:hypothetical protein HYPSUDRAFT_72845 [Hypholoma sublateritium FD-334 SS-4]
MYISLRYRPSLVLATAVLLFAPSQRTSPLSNAHCAGMLNVICSTTSFTAAAGSMAHWPMRICEGNSKQRRQPVSELVSESGQATHATIRNALLRTSPSSMLRFPDLYLNPQGRDSCA